MNLTPVRRKAIYRLLAAIGAVLAVYGLITAEQAEALGKVVEPFLLLLGSLLAERNTPVEK